MNFRPELAAKVMAGEKTVTRRLCSDNPRSPWWRERCAYQPGKVFTVNPGRGKIRVGEARVVRCERVWLGRLSDAEAHSEGFVTVPDFEEAFAGINGAYDPVALVWRIEFEVIGHPGHTDAAARRARVSCVACGKLAHPANMVNVYDGEYQCQECRWGL